VSLMRIVVRSVHEELVEGAEEGLFHNERDVCIGLVSHCLSIRARPSTRRMSQRSSRHGESFAHTFTGSHECMRAQATGTTSAAAVWRMSDAAVATKEASIASLNPSPPLRGAGAHCGQ
jgi:hypothetical protein